jgi:hypothetical protein
MESRGPDISRDGLESEETGSPYLKNDLMNVLLFGATGMVGQGVLRECLLDPTVRQALVIGRRATGQRHEKLRELVLPDVADLAGVESDLAGFDACLFCLGVSAAGMAEERYTNLTYDLTLAVAQTLARLNPGMTFVYVSGMGTDSSERGRTMWARVKGRTENALLKLPFKAAYMFRPAAIVPLHGIQSSTRWTRILYAVMKPLFPVLRALFPNYVTTTEQLGRAMIAVARNGFPKKVLEPPDIRRAPLGPRLVKRIIEFDTVRVIAMMGSPESHLSTSGAVRPPAVGDLGTVVDLTPTSDPDNPATRFIVERTDGGAGCIWLAEFSREELEIVGPTISKSDGGTT